MTTEAAKLFQQLRRQRLPPLPSVRDLIKMYQLSAMKQLSQNFLMDYKLTGKIVKVTGNLKDCVVCEVGPGPGGITRSILERGPRQVILIEKDKRFEKTLKVLQDACPGKIDIVWGDVMSFEMSKMFPEELRIPWEDTLPKIHIIGNLPFNISTPLISRWFSKMSARESAWSYGRVPLTLTFQKEVAERLTAEVGNEQRSRLSVMAEYLTHSSLKFIIKGSAFVPKPDVDVGVVKFIPRREPLIRQPYKLVEKVVRHVFCMRNKYCCRPISTLFPDMVRLHFTKKLFDMSYVFPHTRPYHLTIEDYERLCNAYAEICEKHPEIWEYEYRHAGDEKRFEELHAAKYEPFKNPENANIRPVKMKPLDMVAEELADHCSEEMAAQRLVFEDDDYMFEKKVVEQSSAHVHNL